MSAVPTEDDDDEEEEDEEEEEEVVEPDEVLEARRNIQQFIETTFADVVHA